MTRVSLKEAYDNKDVVAQIYAIRDTAESAVDTSEQAVTTANTASDHVDALVPQVEGAVQNANSASETVAGYDGRLTVAEGAIDELESDLNAVTLRVTTAEGQIVTIQGRVTALETADGQNVKINRINDYAVGLTGNQDNIGGRKGFNDGIAGYFNDWHETNKTGMSINDYCVFAEIETNYNGRYLVFDFLQNSNTATAYGRLVLRCNRNAPAPMWAFRKTNGTNSPLSATAIHVLSDGSKLYLAWKKESSYGSVSCAETLDMSYGNIQTRSGTNVVWYAESDRIVLSDLTGYTDYQVVE